MVRLKMIENYCKKGNKKLVEAPVGNLEEITQFQYNLEKLGYTVSKLDANELVIEPQDSKNVFNIVSSNGKYFIDIKNCQVGLQDWNEFLKLAQNAKTACELVKDFILNFRR